ncbi:DUF1799 domain-containing protein [Nitrosomonas sp. Nm34]|uniref:DUF1799 domain-containing protein n=1 Tax=Nitrosomonas sp. Nm34 TaxID=1881055 RepID=UPI0008E6154C|nr:DUF1799 domain-containing protein [Nitrosomonas sp. Nm34]SFJ00272.1 Phage related hypothetical protein [Nitrosomonas sp. Nm34]
MQQRQGCSQKKLADAARHWAAQGKSANRNVEPDECAADPTEWEQVIAEWQDQLEEEGDDDDGLFAVWPENKQAVHIFIALRRCWRVDGMTGHYFGIDRPSIESTLNMMRIKRKKQQVILESLMIMEDAALPILNRK